MKVALDDEVETMLRDQAAAMGVTAQDVVRLLVGMFVTEGTLRVPGGYRVGTGRVPGGYRAGTSESPVPPEGTVRVPGGYRKGTAGVPDGAGDGVALSDRGSSTDLSPSHPPTASSPHPPYNPPPSPLLPEVADKESERRRAETQELDWRVEQAWAAHVRARGRFFELRNGQRPPEPTLTRELRQHIRRAIREYDRGLLSADSRQLWERKSAVRAAAQGIFLDSFMTGEDPDARGRTYLEPDRWVRPMRGKPDPVPRFAQLYFEAKGEGQ